MENVAYVLYGGAEYNVHLHSARERIVGRGADLGRHDTQSRYPRRSTTRWRASNCRPASGGVPSQGVRSTGRDGNRTPWSRGLV